MVFKNKEQVNKRRIEWSLLFSELRKNAKIKPIESYKPGERYQADIVLFQTMSKIDLNICLLWCIISQSMDG